MAKIMLVEDDNNLREIYQARLQAEGYEIVCAQDGEEALALAVKEKPDLIISDVMMPKISGFDMLDILRSTPEIKDTKVIMMTALSQAEDQQRADKLGTDRYLIKSQVTLEDVARVAKEVLEGKPEDGNGLPAGAVTDSPSAVPTPTVTPVTPAAAPVPDPAVAPVVTPVAASPPVPAPAADPTTPPPVTDTGAAEPPKVDAPASDTKDAGAADAAAPVAAPAPVASAPAATAPVSMAVQPLPAESGQALSEAGKAQSTVQEEQSVKNQIEDFIEKQTGAQFEENSPLEPVSAAPVNPAPEAAPEPAAPAVPAAPAAEPAVPVAPVAEAPIAEVPAPAPAAAPAAAPAPAAPAPAPTDPPSTAAPRSAISNANVTAVTEESNSHVNVNGKKVIQPINDLNQRPDLEKMAAAEDVSAKANAAVINPMAGTVIGGPPTPGQTAAPQNPSAAPENPSDPSMIAL